MTGREAQKERAIHGSFLPAISSLYRDPTILRAAPFFSSFSEVSNRIVRRPSLVAGDRYERASRAYAHGVHRILTKEIPATEGVRSIRDELVRLTGFALPSAVRSSETRQELR